jgi:hypothetical protein
MKYVQIAQYLDTRSESVAAAAAVSLDTFKDPADVHLEALRAAQQVSTFCICIF